MHHYFKQVFDIIANDLKFSDSKTIKKANKALTQIRVGITAIETRSNEKRLEERTYEDSKILLCYEMYGFYNYWNFAHVSVEFLLWIKNNIIDIELSDLNYWYDNYSGFIIDVNRKPDTFEELIKYEALSPEDKVLIKIKNNCSKDVFKLAYKHLKK